MSMTQAAPIFLALALSSGCAVGNKYALHTVEPALDMRGEQALSVATLDEREPVRIGARPARWVGQQRGGYGNPFAVATASGHPLAEDISEALVRALSQRGFQTSGVKTPHDMSPEQAKTELLAQGPARGLLVRLARWKSDTYQNVGLRYALSLEVYDPQGQLIAESSVEDELNLGGSFWNPPAHARKVVPKALQRALERLLNQPQVIQALK